MNNLAKVYDLEKILELFLIDSAPKLINIHHLTPDSDCFILEDGENKFALLKTDYHDDPKIEASNIESVDVEFVQWLHTKKTHNSPFVYVKGDYYALALVR